MRDKETEDGTWTLKVTWHKEGIWRTIIFKSWVTGSRFRCARFMLDGGPTILVPAADLRKVVERKLATGKSVCPLSIDPVAGTINKHQVALSVES